MLRILCLLTAAGAGWAAWTTEAACLGDAIPAASPDVLSVEVAALVPSAAPWDGLLLQDDKGPVDAMVVITTDSGANNFCSVQSDGSFKECYSSQFFSVHAQAAADAPPCSVIIHDHTEGSTICYSTSASSGLTMSCSKDASTRPGFVCTSAATGTPSSSGFCGITTTGICSTWQTAAPPGPSGQQRCSTLGGNSLMKCTALAGASGWCSVDSTQEANVACTSFGGTGFCSTVGGGSGNCSTLVNVGGVNQVNPPDASGKCTVP